MASGGLCSISGSTGHGHRDRRLPMSRQKMPVVHLMATISQNIISVGGGEWHR